MPTITAAQWDAILDRQGHEPCPGVRFEPGLALAEADAQRPALTACVWRPEAAPAGPAPALVAFHGGGFCAGDPPGCGAIAKTLALALGVTTIAPSYRLGAPDRPVFPGIVHDAATAWRWAQTQAAALGVDPRRMAVSGESAGCLLAGHLGVQSPYVAELCAGLPRPAGLISQWGPLDFASRWYDNGENAGAEVNLFGPGGHAARPGRYLHASVLTWARGPLPPALFIYGRRDPTVHARQGRLGLAAWQDAGAHGELLVLENIGHGVQGDNRELRRQYLQKAVDFSAARWASR